MSSTKLRVKLKAYEHRTLDKACAKIVDTVKKRTGGEISGPVPLPTEIQKYTILRAKLLQVQRLKRAIWDENSQKINWHQQSK